MRAALGLVFLCGVTGAVSASAGPGAFLDVLADTPIGGALRPLPFTANVTVNLPATHVVSACEDEGCTLYREYTVSGPGVPLPIKQHPPLGPFFVGEHFVPRNVHWPTSRSGGYGAHAVALYGELKVGAPLRATHVYQGSSASSSGGLQPVEATLALDKSPEHALAYSAVVLAPGALPDEALLAVLSRVVESGGAVALPLSSREPLGSLLEGATLEPLEVDEGARLIELGSNRVVRSGTRDLRASVARRNGGAIIVYDDTEPLSESQLSDALLTAIPRFSEGPRLNYGDPRHTPSSAAAGIAASRPARPALLLLPVFVASVVLLLALRSRRRGGPLLTKGTLLVAAGATVAFLLVPRMLEDDGAETEVRTYVSYGAATQALEEGARAARPSSSGGMLELSGPPGSTPVADARGIATTRRQKIEVEGGGRKLRFYVPGDGVGVIAWLRPVAFEGLRVGSKEGGWPRGGRDAVVTSELPFALDNLWLVSSRNQWFQGGRLEPGATVSDWSPLKGWPTERLKGSDPEALARARLLRDLRLRCTPYGGRDREQIACAFGIGTDADGALVAVQVFSP